MVSFVVSLFISVNGWGVWEILVIYVFGFLGVSILSVIVFLIMVGLLNMLVVVILVFVFMFFCCVFVVSILCY